jgi:hypothetical protein
VILFVVFPAACLSWPVLIVYVTARLPPFRRSDRLVLTKKTAQQHPIHTTQHVPATSPSLDPIRSTKKPENNFFPLTLECTHSLCRVTTLLYTPATGISNNPQLTRSTNVWPGKLCCSSRCGIPFERLMQANRDLMEHSIKLGDCLGKGAFGSVYRVSLCEKLT